jgi:hypothetical protein
VNRNEKSLIHWALIRNRGERIDIGRNEDDFVEHQALDCPHYVPLRGEWGRDWGAILHPKSAKFGELVFEHEWCGCGWHGPKGENEI